MTKTNQEKPPAQPSVLQRINAWLDVKTTRRQVIPAYVLIVASFFGAIWLMDFQNELLADERAASEEAAQIEFCQNRAQRISGLRFALLTLYDQVEAVHLIAATNLDPNDPQVVALRALIDKGREEIDLKYPEASHEDCPFVGNDS